MSPAIGSIVIAAHDEEAVIARCLEHLADHVRRGHLEVVVVCNGCRDRTADVARTFPGVRVEEMARPSKTAALRAGDDVATTWPRIYLDADVEMTGPAAVATLQALSGSALAARPPRRYDCDGAHWVVRRWYGVRERLPSVANALWGAGCYGLSVEGRARFDAFPEVVADDLFINSLFSAQEVTIVATDPIIVHTPLRLADLMRILRRRYRSQDPRWLETGPTPVSPGQRRQLRDLGALLRREPTRVVDVTVYVALITLARLRARWGPAPRWERDNSSRGGS